MGRLNNLFGGAKADVSVQPVNVQEREQALLLLRDYEASGLGWFWSSDASGTIVYVSDCVAERVGRKKDDLIGQFVQSLFILTNDDEDRARGGRLR